MMKRCAALIFVSIFVGLVGALPSNEKDEVSCQFQCLMDVVGFLFNEEENAGEEESIESQGGDLFLCRLENDALKSRAGYRVSLPADFVTKNKRDLSSGTATVCISAGEVDRLNNKILIAENAQVSLLEGRRKLQSMDPIVGKRSILTVQLTSTYTTSNGNQRSEHPGLNKRQIEGAIFGTGNFAPGKDLVNQYRDCSFGALKLEPADAENPVVEVRLNRKIAGGEILGSLQDDILEATEKQIGSVDLFDHIIYCIPDGALMDGVEKWTAFTYFHSHWSFFQRKRCAAMSVTAHELGHNLGFRHSGNNLEAYGDESGYMGYTVYQSGGPVKCFNAHKNWLSGWFDDREYTVNPAVPSPVVVRLVTFVDYDKDLEDNDVVLIRVGQYFLQYNRAKGMNIDTGGMADQVSITFAEDALSDSEAFVGLDSGEIAVIPNFRNKGYDLVVEVCEFGTDRVNPSTTSLAKQTVQVDPSLSAFDYAVVSIHLEDGQQQSQCGMIKKSVSAPITPVPTPEPSTVSTLEPTLSLTPRPTLPPSQAPAAVFSNASRRPTNDFFVALSETEKVQRKQYSETIKDTTKLEVAAGDRNVRRRLKGTR